MVQVSRRGAALLIALTIGAAITPFSVAAQDSTPAAGSLLDGLGLPELVVEVSETGVVAPASIEAGVVLLRVTNTGEAPVMFAVVDAPDDVTSEMVGVDLTQDILGEFWLESKAPIVHDVMPGDTAKAAILLEPGSWLIAGAAGSFEEGSTTPIPGTEFEVTGESPADAADAIAAAATFEYGEYAFAIEGTIPAGPALLMLTNSHTVPHHAIIFGAERLYSDEEAHAGFASLMSGASPTADFVLSEGPLFATPAIAGGGTIWIEVDFEAGAYLAACFIADPGDQVPHAMMGMIKGFEVG